MPCLTPSPNIQRLLSECYSYDISHSSNIYRSIRPATIDDIDNIATLISPLESSGILIHRTQDQLREEIINFYVLEIDDNVIACAALYYHGSDYSAELACLAVHPKFQNMGIGRIILQRLTTLARKRQCVRVFALTTQARYWFEAQGFVYQDIATLPKIKLESYNFERNSMVMKKKLSQFVFEDTTLTKQLII
ncbi:MAG: GNAT family N-acetyltransferase [Ectothiorhodospiraceae bacterium]|nr:GNAT family N-acetyltransferase [Ectothiorhodospiraceae bacterium]